MFNLTPEKEIELTPAEDNPWYKFFLKSLELDATHNKHRGWHWFWGIYHLHEKINAFPEIYLKGIQTILPDEHWLNQNKSSTIGSVANDKRTRADAVNVLHKFFQDPHSVEKITEIDFSKIEFPSDIDFSNFIFPIPVSFKHSKFLSADFSRTHFCGDAYFTKAIFYQRKILHGDIFGLTNFQEAIFHRHVDFSEAQLKERFVFTGTKFIQGATFKKTTISSVNFEKSEFYKTTKFCETKFHEEAIFNNSTSSGVMEFYDAIFYKEAQFSNAKLNVANFAGVTFFNNASFFQANFSQIANFRRVIFSEIVRFNSAKLGGGTSFSDAVFKTNAPHFHNAEISDGITWDRVIFPSIKNDTNRDLVQQNKEAYENLSGHMEKMKKHDEQHLFFRQEMRCRRWLGSPFNHFIHGIYEWLADYGYGVGYALCWWAGHIALGILVIVFIAMCGGIRYHDSLPCAISVSVANANPYALFGFDSIRLAECYDMFNVHAPILFAIVKVIQTILGVGLLFLVLLTLRIRFRLK